MSGYFKLVDRKNLKLFVQSAYKGDLKTIKEIFKVEDVFYHSPSDKRTWLHRILTEQARQPPVEIIQYLIDQKIPLNMQDTDGMTALHLAMTSKNVPAMIALLDAGADPNIPNREGIMPLAAIGNIEYNEELLEKFLKNGANVNFPYSRTKSILETYGVMAKYSPDEYESAYKMMLKYASRHPARGMKRKKTSSLKNLFKRFV